MRMQNSRRNVRICWLPVLFIVIFLPSDIFMTDVYGIGSVQCPPCTRWVGYCQPYCDNLECQQTCAPDWTCCPSGGCIPPLNICCGTTACPNPDNCCEDKTCYGTGWFCCLKGTGQICPIGYTCHGTTTCCEPDGDYCPGFYLPPFWDDCCPSGFSCKGDGRCCPNEQPSLCVRTDGSYTCYDPSDCQKTCINGQVLPCGGELCKICCDRSCCDKTNCEICKNVNCVEAKPTNMQQIEVRDLGGGILLFHYVWESTTGELADLGNRTVGEKVDYPGSSNPYCFPSPPWAHCWENPTIIDLDAKRGYLYDIHSPGSFIQPYQFASVSANQIYRYRCNPCGEYQTLLDIGSIMRFVTGGEEPFPDLWRYSIIKSGAYAEIFPLP